MPTEAGARATKAKAVAGIKALVRARVVIMKVATGIRAALKIREVTLVLAVLEASSAAREAQALITTQVTMAVESLTAWAVTMAVAAASMSKARVVAGAKTKTTDKVISQVAAASRTRIRASKWAATTKAKAVIPGTHPAAQEARVVRVDTTMVKALIGTKAMDLTGETRIRTRDRADLNLGVPLIRAA